MVEAATPKDAGALARLHAASFHRGWGDGEFDQMPREQNTLIHRLCQGRRLIGFAASRLAADEAEILSIAVAPEQRGRGLSRDLFLTHLGHLAGRGVRTVFLEVEENNMPARRLYAAHGFVECGPYEGYTHDPNSVFMTRDLAADPATST